MAKKRKNKSGPASTGLAGISTAALQAELENRRSRVGALQAQARELESQLNSLRSEIGVFNGLATSGKKRGRPPGSKNKSQGIGKGAPGRKRAKNKLNLEEALAKTLKGRTMSVTDVTKAVQTEGGYKTTSENFRTIVNQALIRSKAFKKVSRGMYTAA